LEFVQKYFWAISQGVSNKLANFIIRERHWDVITVELNVAFVNNHVHVGQVETEALEFFRVFEFLKGESHLPESQTL
jgi:hypothetical protein